MSIMDILGIPANFALSANGIVLAFPVSNYYDVTDL